MRNFRRKRGFERASSLVQGRIRKVGESRGFAVTRLLTHWHEIVGSDLSTQARPVDVTYGRGFGATLTLLTSGAAAPMVEMQKEKIRERVNTCYGYAAIQKIRLTQTSATGFAEPQTEFAHPADNVEHLESTFSSAKADVGDVQDTGLRTALERLGANVLSQQDRKKGSS